MPVPEYACAIIEDASGRLLFELRPAQAEHAADALTCFGGRREGNENDRTCLLRELHEELAWQPSIITPACELWQGSRFIAQFFTCAWTGTALRTEPGRVAVWAPWRSLPGLPLSPWHAQVLAAYQRGDTRAEVV